MGKCLPAAALAAVLRLYARSSPPPSRHQSRRLAAALAAALRLYARSSPAAAKAPKPPPAPPDTPRNDVATGASSERGELQDLAAACELRKDKRVLLAEVVSDCTRRWFQDALKEARTGDASIQVLVGQMYHSDYGVNKNEHKNY